MPIDPEELLTEADELLILPASATIAQAAAMLRDRGGDDAWMLVVDKGGGAYALGTFGSLRRAVEGAPDPAAAFMQPLGALDLTPLEAVQQDSMSTDAAFDRANYETEAEALLVLKGDAILGLLTQKDTRAAEDAFAAQSLIDLYAKARQQAQATDFFDEETSAAADEDAFASSSGEGKG